MRAKFIFSMLLLTAVTISFDSDEAGAAVNLQVATPGLSFSLSDYQPAPPNVYVHQNSGRPYYVERNRRVYMKKKNHGHEKYKDHHEDNGNHKGKGHDKH